MQTFVACLGLFLGKFQIGVMPYVYISTAILSLSFGSIYSYFAKRIIVSSLLNWTLVILGLALLLMNTLFYMTGYVSYVFAMLCLANFIYGFCDLIFESQINSLFTLQQAKRLLGIISSGKIIGGIVAGLTLSWLAITIKTTYIIFNISILFLVALYLQISLQHHYPHRFVKIEKQSTPELAGGKQSIIYFFIRKKYILYLFALIALLKFGNDIFDFLFNGVAQKYYSHQARLTVYLGIIFAAVDGLNLIISIFLFNRLSEKIGIILMLCLQPTIMALLMITMQFANIVDPSLGILLIFVTITQLLDGTTRYSINSPALLILLQPLNSQERALARAKQTTITMPLVTIVSGLVLLLFAKNPSEHIHIFTVIFIILSAASLLLLYQLRGLYLKELIATLYNRIFVKPEWISDKFSLTVLKKAAHSKNLTEKLYALTVLETLNIDEFNNQLLKTLDPSDRDSFLYALNKIDEHHISAATPRLLALYSEIRNDEELLAKIVLTLGTLNAAEHMELFNELLNSAQRQVKESAMVVCLKHGKSTSKERAQQLLNQMINSTQPEERKSAARILRHINHAEYKQSWGEFLRDPDFEVRKIACTAIRDIPNEEFYPTLLENLLIPSVKNAASMAILAQPHKIIIPYILKIMPSLKDDELAALLRLLGYLKAPRIVSLLLTYADNPNKYLAHLALLSLKKQHYQAITLDEVARIKYLLSLEQKYNALLINWAQSFGSVEDKNSQPLLDLLNREITLSQERLFILLGFYHSENVIGRVQKSIKTRNEDMTAYAHEVLQNLFNSGVEAKLIPLLIYVPGEEGATDRATSTNHRKTLSHLIEIIHMPYFYLPIIKAAAIYYIGKNSIYELKDAVCGIETNQPLIQETCEWALKKIN